MVDVAALIARVPMLSGQDALGCRLEPLGGLTNRVYRLHTPTAGRWIVRVPGRGAARFIDRINERAAHEAATGAGIALPLAHFDPADGLSARPDTGAEPVRGAMAANPDALRQAARRLAATHALEVTVPRLFRPLEDLAGYLKLLDPADTALDDALRRGARRAARIGVFHAPDRKAPLCHVDPVPENFLELDGRLYLMDWEYAGHGPPQWDLADFVAESGLTPAATGTLLASYREARGTAPDPAALLPWVWLCHLVAAAWARAQALAFDDAHASYERLARARLARAGALQGHVRTGGVR